MASGAPWLWIGGGLLGLLTVMPLAGGGRPAAAQASAAPQVIVPRAADGQYYADIRVGDHQMRALIDPDADTVFIAGSDAALLGLGDGTAERDVAMPPMRIGTLAMNGVTARVAPYLPVTILGRPALARLHGASIEDGALRLH